MGRYRRRRRNYSRSHEKSGEEEAQWVVFAFIFVTLFAGYFAWGFITNCLFEWPIRWDVGTCWSEQEKPAQDKAMEKAIDFVPSRLKL